MYFCNQTPTILHFLFFYSFIVLIMICRENPAKCHSLAKNPPKYSTAYTVQQSNCRWHCEPTFFLCWAFYNDKSFHTLPLQSLHLLSVHLQFLPLRTLRLVLLVSLIIKTKRIAERSAIVNHRHTDKVS